MNFLSYASGYIGVPLAFAINRSFTYVMDARLRASQSGLFSPVFIRNIMPGLTSPEFIRNFCPRNYFCFLPTPNTNLGPLDSTLMNLFRSVSGYIGVPLAFAINRSFTCVMGVGQRTPQSGLTSPVFTRNLQPGLSSPELARNTIPASEPASIEEKRPLIFGNFYSSLICTMVTKLWFFVFMTCIIASMAIYYASGPAVHPTVGYTINLPEDSSFSARLARLPGVRVPVDTSLLESIPKNARVQSRGIVLRDCGRLALYTQNSFVRAFDFPSDSFFSCLIEEALGFSLGATLVYLVYYVISPEKEKMFTLCWLS